MITELGKVMEETKAIGNKPPADGPTPYSRF